MVARIDCVFIRKSTDSQKEEGQIANVQNELKTLHVAIADEHWFTVTVSRRKVQRDPDFKRLMKLVEAGQVGTVYVESQDRWGTADREELYALLGRLRANDTRLYDLKAKRDLTEKDLAGELLTFMNSVKSENELKDTAYRSLRTRVNNFQATATWPTGLHPYGYGKAVYSPTGRLLWVWQPTSRLRGDRYSPDDKGKLKLTDRDVALPRKLRGELTVLVPSINQEWVANVRLIFDLFTRMTLSRRQISTRLNKEGRRYYDREWTHSLVSQVLNNAAYVGDIEFGKTQSGELHTFDGAGLVVPVKKSTGKTVKRQAAERQYKSNTHEGLIDRKTWDAAKAKIQLESERTTHAPKKAEYYLRQIFVCGHCGKNMTGRTDIDHKTKARTVSYVCTSWMLGNSAGQSEKCGMNRITHADAEQLLLDKIKEENLAYDAAVSAGARANIEARLEALRDADEAAREDWWRWVDEGAKQLAKYLATEYKLTPKDKSSLETAARRFYRHGENADLRHLPLAARDFKLAIDHVEKSEAKRAKARLDELKAEHNCMTLAWAKASAEQQQALKAECDRLEAEMGQCREHQTPLRDRLAKLFGDDDARQVERGQLQAEWPTLEGRERGEALRKLFHQVTLFWSREWIPASTKPTRPIKTKRQGRYRYKLLKDKTVWKNTSPKLARVWKTAAPHRSQPRWLLRRHGNSRRRSTCGHRRGALWPCA